jgi:hypothetical protein
LAGCSGDDYCACRFLAIPADSVIAFPDTVQLGEEVYFVVRCLGPNSCTHLSHYILSTEDSCVSVTVYGEEHIPEGHACADVIVEIDAAGTYRPPGPGIYTFSFRQYGEATLDTAVVVAPAGEKP